MLVSVCVSKSKTTIKIKRMEYILCSRFNVSFIFNLCPIFWEKKKLYKSVHFIVRRSNSSWSNQPTKEFISQHIPDTSVQPKKQTQPWLRRENKNTKCAMIVQSKRIWAEGEAVATDSNSLSIWHFSPISVDLLENVAVFKRRAFFSTYFAISLSTCLPLYSNHSKASRLCSKHSGTELGGFQPVGIFLPELLNLLPQPSF